MHDKIKLIVLSGLFFLPLAASDNPFLWDTRIPQRDVSPGQDFSLIVDFSIPPGHHLYKEKTRLEFLEGEGMQLVEVAYSPSKTVTDPWFNKKMEIFEGEATLKAILRVDPVAVPGPFSGKLLLSYQGCSESLCYREMREEIFYTIDVASSVGLPPKVRGPFFSRILLAFAGGFLTDFTPCVLPIIPITLAFIGVRRERSRKRNILLTSILVLTMALTYAVLGLAAASLGKNLGFLFQGIPFQVGVSLLYFVFSLALFGWIPFQVPEGLRNRMAQWKAEGVLGSVVAGVTIGFLAAPCVGPVIASLLLYVTKGQDLGQGFWLLFAFGLGMGSLFLIVGSFYHLFVGGMKGRSVVLWVKRALAVLMLIPAFYYGFVAWRGIRASIRPPGVAPVLEDSNWEVDPSKAFERARAQGKPIFVDFFATWCLPCLEMERKTFSQPEIVDFLRKNFIPLRVDCTTETASCSSMIQRYQVVGWPTYLLLDPQGQQKLSVVGKVLGPREFVEALTLSLEKSE